MFRPFKDLVKPPLLGVHFVASLQKKCGHVSIVSFFSVYAKMSIWKIKHRVPCKAYAIVVELMRLSLALRNDAVFLVITYSDTLC